MIICFFSSNPIFAFKRVGSPMYWTFQFPTENCIELPFYWHHCVRTYYPFKGNCFLNAIKAYHCFLIFLANYLSY